MADGLKPEIEGGLGLADPITVEGLDVGVVEVNSLELGVFQEDLECGVDGITLAGPQASEPLLWQHPHLRPSSAITARIARLVSS